MILNTIADLQALTSIPTDNHVHVLGYNTPADGGGGDFYWDATSTQLDNGGTIFDCGATVAPTPPATLSTGKWVRYYTESVNLKWFGAKGDGVTNDSPAFQQAIDFCERVGVKDFVIPHGYFYLDESVYVRIGGIKFIGQGCVLREGCLWGSMNTGPNPVNPNTTGFSIYGDYNYSNASAYNGSVIIVKNNISGIIYDESVAESVYWRGVGFISQNGRNAGTTYAIDFKSRSHGPTWPFYIHECFFMGFNRVFTFSTIDNNYSIAFVTITHCAFTQNDEVFYQGFMSGTDIRYVCWGFTFEHNKCHHNTRIIYGSFGKDLVTISNNNFEGNIEYSKEDSGDPDVFPLFTVDLEISDCAVIFHGNHIESMLSDCVSISSMIKNASGVYNAPEGTTALSFTHYVDIYGNSVGTGETHKAYSLTGCVVKINEITPIFVHACEILENSKSLIYLNDYALENGSIIKFSDQQWLTPNFIDDLSFYRISRNPSELAYLDNSGEQWVKPRSAIFNLNNGYTYNGDDIKYSVSVYKVKNNSPHFSTTTSTRYAGWSADTTIRGILYPAYGESLIVCIFPEKPAYDNLFRTILQVLFNLNDNIPIEISTSVFSYQTTSAFPRISPVFESTNIVDEIGTFEAGQTWYNGTKLRMATSSGTLGTLSGIVVNDISDNKIQLNSVSQIAQGQYIEIDGLQYRILELRGDWATLSAAPPTPLTSNSVSFTAPTLSDVMPPEEDPVYNSDKPKIIKTRQNYYGSLSGTGLSLDDASNEHGFTYQAGGSNSPLNGPFWSMGSGLTNDNYQMQMVGDYNDGGRYFNIRTRNGDTSTWNPWRTLLTDNSVNNYAIANQNSSAQTANAWISGNFITQGKIGIGTNTPFGSLEITGNSANTLSIIRNTASTGYSDLRLMNDQNSTTHMLAVGYTGSSYPGSYWSGGISGEVGAIGTIGNYPFEIGTNNTSRISVLTNGNVGIGKTNPAQKLDVNGTIRQGNVTSAMLKADSNGDITSAAAGTDYVEPSYLSSGTYTPTITAMSGVGDTYSPGQFTYTKTGEVVHVAGTVEVTTGSSSIMPYLGMYVSLPIASAIGSQYDVTEVGSGIVSSSAAMIPVCITGNTTGNNANVLYQASHDSTIFVQFDYTLQ